MPKAIAITHVAFEDLGTLEPELKQAGYEVQFVSASTADLRAEKLATCELLVVLGGPIGVYEREAYPFLEAELDLLRLRLAAKRKTLGICLGAQLMAAAAGAAVYPGTNGKEIGWSSLHAGQDVAQYPEMAELLAPDLRVLHWHGDTFDLPTNARHLAGTRQYPNQAFAFENYALALQFHPEVTSRGLENWYVGHTCELGHADISVPQLRRDSLEFAPALETAAARFWRQWLTRE